MRSLRLTPRTCERAQVPMERRSPTPCEWRSSPEGLLGPRCSSSMGFHSTWPRGVAPARPHVPGRLGGAADKTVGSARTK